MTELRIDRAPFEPALRLIRDKSFDFIHVYGHIRPDGDTVGSVCALVYLLRKMGKRATLRFLDKIPASFHFLTDALPDDDFPCENVITADVASKQLLGEAFDESDRIRLVIDHHTTTGIDGEVRLCLPGKGATGEIILELAVLLDLVPDAYLADCLYTAIATDTGCFKYSNTSADTFRAAACLAQYAKNGNFYHINQSLFEKKPYSYLLFESALIKGMEFYFGGKVAVITVTDALLREYNLQESLTGDVEQLSRTPSGVVLGITVKERAKNLCKVSLRSTDEIDCARICAVFGGGGHKAAAGCTITGSVQSARDQVLAVIKEKGLVTP